MSRTSQERGHVAASDGDRVVSFAETTPALDESEINEAYVQLAHSFDPTMACTFTHRNGVSVAYAQRDFDKFLTDLTVRGGEPARGLVVREDTLAGRPHFHALIAAPRLTPEEVVASWEWRNRKKDYSDLAPPNPEPGPLSWVRQEQTRRQAALDAKRRSARKKSYRGNAKVEPYDRSRGFATYLVRKVTGSLDQTSWRMLGEAELDMVA